MKRNRSIFPRDLGSAGAWVLVCSLLLLGCDRAANRSSPPEVRVIPPGDGVTDALNDYLRQHSVAQDNSFEVAYIDLNNDKIDDALVLMQGLDWCNLSGCTLLVFRGLAGDQFFEFVSAIERVRQPIVVSRDRTSGWRDLVVSTQIKQRPQDVSLGFDGQRYPSDATEGTVLPALADIDGDSIF